MLLGSPTGAPGTDVAVAGDAAVCRTGDAGAAHSGRPTGNRADRAARAGRVFLLAHRQLHQLFVAAASAGRVGWQRRSSISEQAVDYGLNARAQQQMGLKESALGEVLGPTVISDVALIGSDMFLAEGGAIGVLFQARSSTLLGNDIQRQRTALMAETGAKEEKMTLAGQTVSFISTPDNRVRSFYAVDGDYHLVTTSRTMAQRFLQIGKRKPDDAAPDTSLGGSAEFRTARRNLPLNRDDVIFIYLSRAFFENLMTPHYQIEMVRRLRSAVEMELVVLAQLFGRGEGRGATSIEQLVAADLLPTGFGQRADGSRLELIDGKLIDSLARRTGHLRADSRHGRRASLAQRGPAVRRFSDRGGPVGAARSVLRRHSTNRQQTGGARSRDARRPGGSAHAKAHQFFEPLARSAGQRATWPRFRATWCTSTRRCGAAGWSQPGDHFLVFGLQICWQASCRPRSDRCWKS